MLTLELETRDIPLAYERFAHEIGDGNWKDRVAALKSEIKGNPFLRRLHEPESAIAYGLERLRELHAQHRGVPVQAYNDHALFPAAAFAAQVLSVVDGSNKILAERFKARVRAAIRNNPADLRALRLEFTTATHFLRAGRKVSWPEMGARPGQRIYDLLVEDLGPRGLEIECKSFSEDKGRRVPRRQALEFFWLLRSRHWKDLSKISTGIVAVLTLQRDLPSAHSARLQLANLVASRVLAGQSGGDEAGAKVRIDEFDHQRIPQGDDPRAMLDTLTRTTNREVVMMETSNGGLIVAVLESEQDDTVMDGILKTLKSSASSQFSGTRAAMMVAGLEGISSEQLLDIALQERDPEAVPTALRYHASKFLSSEGREHIIGVVFLSSSALRPVAEDVVDSGGTAYFFPNRESPHWSEDFSGQFGREQSGRTPSIANGPSLS